MAGNISMMAAFAARLEQQAKTDPNIRVLTADLVGSCALKGMERDCPGQFINVGIAEQNMVGIAAGLAHEGMRPYTYTFAVFHSMRACEQVRTDVFYNGLNVKVIGTHCGISTGFAGSTHFALEDIGIIRSMPASVILVPADPVSAEKTADVAYGFDRGMYIRLDRNPLPVLYPPEAVFEIGKAKVLRDGKDVVLFAIGAAVHSALEAAEEIQTKSGKSVAVVDIYSIKPLDRKCVLKYAKQCSLAITVEEHNICGGLFGAVSECISEEDHACRVYPIAIQEVYPHGNAVDRGREALGLNGAGIRKTVLKLLRQMSERRSEVGNEGD